MFVASFFALKNMSANYKYAILIFAMRFALWATIPGSATAQGQLFGDFQKGCLLMVNVIVAQAIFNIYAIAFEHNCCSAALGFLGYTVTWICGYVFMLLKCKPEEKGPLTGYFAMSFLWCAAQIYLSRELIEI